MWVYLLLTTAIGASADVSFDCPIVSEETGRTPTIKPHISIHISSASSCHKFCCQMFKMSICHASTFVPAPQQKQDEGRCLLFKCANDECNRSVPYFNNPAIRKSEAARHAEVNSVWFKRQIDNSSKAEVEQMQECNDVVTMKYQRVDTRGARLLANVRDVDMEVCLETCCAYDKCTDAVFHRSLHMCTLYTCTNGDCQNNWDRTYNTISVGERKKVRRQLAAEAAQLALQTNNDFKSTTPPSSSKKTMSTTSPDVDAMNNGVDDQSISISDHHARRAPVSTTATVESTTTNGVNKTTIPNNNAATDAASVSTSTPMNATTIDNEALNETAARSDIYSELVTLERQINDTTSIDSNYTVDSNDTMSGNDTDISEKIHEISKTVIATVSSPIWSVVIQAVVVVGAVAISAGIAYCIYRKALFRYDHGDSTTPTAPPSKSDSMSDLHSDGADADDESTHPRDPRQSPGFKIWSIS